MELRIETLREKKLVGKRMRMTLSNNTTHELWRSFMPKRKEIKNYVTNDLISMQVYKCFDFKDFSLKTEFEKWAAIEVADFDSVPDDMETFTLAGGLYAIFIHKGDSNTFSKTFPYLFSTVLPTSNYAVDDRPHFEILGEKYKLNDPGSEEELWIPVKMKE